MMKTRSFAVRTLAPLALLALAACQTMPTQQDTAAQTGSAPAPAPAPSTPAPQPAPGVGQADSAQPAEEAGIPVAVLLADTQPQEGWTPVNLREGVVLYVNPDPIVSRPDLTGVQAGTGRQGEGLLALELNNDAVQRVIQTTTRHPNGRLALVVGRTMMAAPAYDTPVTATQLVFAVGSEQNAMAAARAIAGVAPEGAPADGAPAATGDAPASTSPVR